MSFLSGAMAQGHPLVAPIYTPELDHIATLFADAGYELRLVGGAVRDIMTGKTPGDIDLASTALPGQALDLLQKARVKVVETGLQHGTIMAVVNKIPFEITTLRIDEVTDGRHATVKFTTDWHLDALRRDLTFNAMSVGLATGELFDYFDGAHDLERKIVRFVGNPEERIHEDYLRILRYFRFHARISGGGGHVADLMGVFRTTAKGLDGISGERIWKEVKQLLVLDNSNVTVQSMMDCGVGETILLPGACNTAELGRVLAHTREPSVLLASLFACAEGFEAACERWKLANTERDMGRFVIQHRGKMDLRQATHILSDAKKQIRDSVRERLVETLRYDGRDLEAETMTTWQVPEFPVTGTDLKAMGIANGKHMGYMLKDMRNLWKQGDFALTRDQLLATARDPLSAPENKA